MTTIEISLLAYFGTGLALAFFFLWGTVTTRRQLTTNDLIFAFMIFQIWPHAILLQILLKVFPKDNVLLKRKAKMRR